MSRLLIGFLGGSLLMGSAAAWFAWRADTARESLLAERQASEQSQREWDHKRKELSDQREQLDRDLRQARQQAELSGGRIAEIESAYRERVGSLETQLAQAGQTASEAAARLTESVQQLNAMTERTQELESARQRAEESARALAERIGSIESELAGRTAELARASQAIANGEERLARQEDRIRELEQVVARQTARIAELTKALEAASEQALRNLRDSVPPLQLPQLQPEPEPVP